MKETIPWTDEPQPEPGLPWRFILLPLEYALVFAAVWWVYNLIPRPERQYTYEQFGLILNLGKAPRWVDFSISSYQGTITIYDLVQGQQATQVTTGIGKMKMECAAYHDGQGVLAVGMTSGHIILVDTRTMKTIGELPAHTAQVLEVAFSPDGKLLISCGLDAAIRAWDLATQKLTRLLYQGRTAIGPCCSKVIFSPDGRLLYTAFPHDPKNNSKNRYWEIATGTELPGPDVAHHFEGYLNGTTKMVYELDEALKRADLAKKEKRVFRIWDLLQGKEVDTPVELPTFGRLIFGMDFSPDGQKVAYGIEEDFVPDEYLSARRDVVVLDRTTKSVLQKFSQSQSPRFLKNEELLTKQFTHTSGDVINVWNLSAEGGHSPRNYLICALLTAVVVGFGNLFWWLIRSTRASSTPGRQPPSSSF